MIWKIKLDLHGCTNCIFDHGCKAAYREPDCPHFVETVFTEKEKKQNIRM